MFKGLGINLQSQVFYLNAERCGPRISYPAGYEEGILSDGANAAYLIDRADMQQRKISEGLAVSGLVTKFSIHVEEWLNVILGDVNFSVSTDLIKSSTDVIPAPFAIAEASLMFAITADASSFVIVTSYDQKVI